MTDIAALGFSIDSGPLATAAANMNAMASAAQPAAAGAQRLAQSTQQAGQAAMQAAQGLAHLTTTGQRASNVIALNTIAMKQLGLQLNDAATMLASGSSPFQVMATQGGQVLQVLQGANGGVTGAVKDLGSRLAGVATIGRVAIGGIAAAAVTAAFAINAWDDKVKSLTRSLNGIGRGTGLTPSAMQALVLNGANGLSVGQATESAGMYARAGIDGATLAALLGSQQRFGRAFGMGAGDAGAMLAGAFGDPSKGLADLAKVFGPLGYETEMQVRRLQALGRVEEARAVMFRAFDSELKKTTDASTALTKAMESAAVGASKLWAWLGSQGGTLTPEQQLKLAIDKLKAGNPGILGNPIAPNIGIPDKFPIPGKPGALDMRSILAESAAATIAQDPERAAGGSEKAAEVMRRYRDVLAETGQSWAGVIDKMVKRWSYLQAQIDQVTQAGELDAKAIAARTAAERLAVEQERIALAAKFDTTKELTKEAEQRAATNRAIAETTRVLSDAARTLREERSVIGGSVNDRIKLDAIRYERDLREKALTGGSAAGVARAAGASSPMAILEAQLGKGAADIQPFLAAGGQDLQARFAAWCAAALNSALQQSGVKGSGSNMARSLLNVGTPVTDPQRGDIVVLRRGSDGVSGHTGFYDSTNPDGTIRVLGGNQGGRVSYSNFDPSRVLGYRRIGDEAPALTIGGRGSASPQIEALVRDFIENRQRSEVLNPIADDIRGIEAQRRVMGVQNSTFGMDPAVVAGAVRMQEALNIAHRAGITLTDEMIQKAREAGEAERDRTHALEESARTQRRYIEGLDAIRDFASDSIAGPLKAIARGQSPGEAFKQAGLRLGDKMIDMGVNSILGPILGEKGSAFSPLLSALGLGGKQSTAMMQVQAGIVNVGGVGGMLGGSSGGGGIFSRIFGGGGSSNEGTISSLFSSSFSSGGGAFANGGIMTSRGPVGLRTYAAGGVANSPQLALYGEGSTPEAFVPLPDGRAIPVAMRGGRAANNNAQVFHIGGPTINIEGNADEKTISMMEARLARHTETMTRQFQRNIGPMIQTYNKRQAV